MTLESHHIGKIPVIVTLESSDDWHQSDVFWFNLVSEVKRIVILKREGGGGNQSTTFHHICDRTFCLICFSFMEETVGESVVRCSSGTIRIDWSKSTVKIEYWLHKRFLIHAKLNSLIVDLCMVNFIDHFQQSHSGVKTFLVNAFVYDLLQTTK